MANSEFRLIINESDRVIEDVIDARKKIGQYDICRRRTTNSATSQNYLYNAYSIPVTGTNEEDRRIRVDDTAVWISEGGLCNSYSGEPEILNIGPTDSEITVVRVKREGLQYKSGENKWNLHDDAVPGDGSYLGESPSLVNLVTLVGQSLQSLGNNKVYEYNEYLVPLSSWDPSDNPHHLPDLLSNNCRAAGSREETNKPKLHIIKSPNGSVARRPGLAGRITNFLRKRRTKTSKLSVEVSPENKTIEEMSSKSGNS